MTRPQEISYEIEMQLCASYPVPVSIDLILRRAKRGGFDFTRWEIEREMVLLSQLKVRKAVLVRDPPDEDRWIAAADFIDAWRRQHEPHTEV